MLAAHDSWFVMYVQPADTMKCSCLLGDGRTHKVTHLSHKGTQCLLDLMQGVLLETIVVPAAAAYGLQSEYQYLRPSIKRFPQGYEQEQLALEAGFKKAVHYEIGFGMMGVLVAIK